MRRGPLHGARHGVLWRVAGGARSRSRPKRRSRRQREASASGWLGGRRGPWARFYAAHETILDMRIYALCDLLLDVVVRTGGSRGPDAEGSAEARVGAGGQAA